MLKKLWWEKILACLDDRQLVVNDLIKQLQLSPTTLRRDLTEIEQQGLLKRVHGGVKLQKSYEVRIEE